MQLSPNILFHDRYRLIEIKGRGSFGEVWLARDEHLDMDVAIKVYIALDDRGVAEFKSEYRTTFGLNHPNLLHANHFDQFEQRPYLVMPYCPESATQYIGNIDEPTFWRFLRDVAGGLQYLHSVEIVHHDIKPDNVLIDTEGNFLVTDFGISKKMRSTLRRNSARQVEEDTGGGSMSYMGPEMFSSQPESVKATDIWALGASLYELCEGELPFFGQGGVMQLRGAEIPEIKGNYSDDIKKIVQMCLAKDTWDRPLASQLYEYAQAKLSGQALPDFEGMVPFSQSLKNNENSGGQPKNGTISENEALPKKKNKVWGWVVGLVAAAAIAIVAFLMMPPKEDPRQKTARENVSVYLSKVDECQNLILSGSYENYQPLLEARNELDEIKQLEDSGRLYIPETYNRYSQIESQLDNKCREIGKQYEDFAKGYIGLDEQEAQKYFNIAKQLIPDLDSEPDIDTNKKPIL